MTEVLSSAVGLTMRPGQGGDPLIFFLQEGLFISKRLPRTTLLVGNARRLVNKLSAASCDSKRTT